MSSKTYTRSFAGGEIAATLAGRLDLAKFQTGLAKCLNFEVTPQGPVENRPGFEYVLKVKINGAVLIPFVYNAEQSFAIEVGAGYMRFHTQSATLLETAKAITAVTQATPGVFTIAGHGWSNGDWVYLAAMGGMAELSGRWGIVTGVTANTFRLNDLFGAPISTATLDAYTGGGTAARVYEIASPYTAAYLFDLHYVQSADVLTVVSPGYAPRELRRLGATNWTITSISFVPTIATPGIPGSVIGGPGGGTSIDHYYVTTAIKEGTLEESLASPVDTEGRDLTVVGNFIDVTPAAVAGAVRYNVYKKKSGIFGFIGQSDGSAVRDNNIDPDLSKTPPLALAPFTADFPRAVSYFEQRRAFAGTGALPQSMWLTRSGTESNMTYSIPVQDDDAITARIVAREANTVRHLVPLNDLLALTSGGLWRIASAGGDALTPSSFSVRPQGYVGASNVQPVTGANSVIYVQDRGSHVREVTYRWESQGYEAGDLSVLAPHLFDYKNIIQLAYARSPLQVLWAVRDDGVLLGLTHTPEHEIKAWHQHDTQGLFKSVCAVPEGDEDGVYAIIEREINGTTVQYVERKHTRRFDTLADAFFVDAGLTYDGAETELITGLWHLEGCTVSVLADGGVSPAQVVIDGQISLADAPASKVQVGLGYNSDFQTMPVSLELAAMGQGIEKNVNEVKLRVHRSLGIMAGPDFDNLRSYAQRTQADAYGTPPSLLTGVASLKISPKWQEDGSVCVRQAEPVPLTILSMTLELAKGG